MIRYGLAGPDAPLTRRIIDLPADAKCDVLNQIAKHLATADTLTRTTVERYVDEALAVSR